MTKFKEELIQVSDLETDPRVQRPLDLNKVERIIKHFNVDALGTLTISRRVVGGHVPMNIIIDGQHRWMAVRQVTDNTGLVSCHVFEGLTVPQEAEMFLDLNNTTKPSVMSKFFVRGTAEDPAAVNISAMLHSYGWTVSPQSANGNINAIAAVERLYHLSERDNVEPNLVQATIMVITKAWGNDRFGVQGALFEGIGRLILEHGSLIDLINLSEKLSGYPGGPYALHTNAQQIAKMRRMRVAMAVAELVTEEYNKGKRQNMLSPWRKRS